MSWTLYITNLINIKTHTFDTVSHKILNEKLHNIGMTRNTSQWFGSYLSNRKQRVRVNDMLSEYLPVKYGVPQGSILGPTLFSIYINDIIEIVKDSSLTLYADDTVLYNTDHVGLQQDLDRISRWCENNLLTINTKKSQYLRTSIITKSTANENPTQIIINNKPLKLVEQYNYLGVVLETELTFLKHREKVKNVVQSKLNFFRSIRCFLTIPAALMIYKATILPLMEYADFIYDQGIKYVNESLQKLQNQGLSTVYNQHIMHYTNRDSMTTLHRNSKLFRLDHRRYMHCMQFAYSLSKNESLLDDRDIGTRRHDGVLFIIPRYSHYKYPQNPNFKVMKLWNRLPTKISRCLQVSN